MLSTKYPTFTKKKVPNIQVSWPLPPLHCIFAFILDIVLENISGTILVVMFVMISSFAELRIQAMVATIGVGCEEQPPTYAAIVLKAGHHFLLRFKS
jgi:hypothetical protein